ncbi:MAG: hypothetical protein H6948_17400 [Zoogloeaceae bacterium]|nr:hypothetical protein [Zoogloeaceae bacterium]
MSSPKSLSSRQRFWLAHLQACAQQGTSLSAYASAQGLKVGALYEAKSRLRKQGAWPPPGARFVRVQATPTSVPDGPRASLFRVSLRNGVVVEVAGGEVSAVLEAAARLS